MLILLSFFCKITLALNVGIQDPRGQQFVNTYWKPTFQQVGYDINESVNVISLADDTSYFSAAQNYNVDIVFGAPTLYECISISANYAPFASIIQYENSIATSYSGAAIFSKRGSNITTIQDLINKRISLAEISFQAGCQAQWYEMSLNGLGLFSSTKQVQISGSYANTILSVYNGEADVGFVRAGQIEILSTGGGPTIDNFQYVNIKNDTESKKFPWPISTQLLPISLMAVSPELTPDRKILILESMFSISENSSAAMLGNYTQWTTPQNYWPILQLQSKLGYIVNLNSSNVHCLTNNQVYDFIQCDPGYKVISDKEDSCKLQKIPCPSGNICICSPCFKEKNKKKYLLSIVIPIATVFTVSILVLTNFLLIKKLKKGELSEIDQNYQNDIKKLFGNSYHIQIQYLLGTGSYGKVYLATWNKTLIALKITQPFNTSINEGLLARGLIHENIVRTYDHRLRRNISSNGNNIIDITNNSDLSHGSLNKVELIVIQEYCEKGSLTKYLQSNEFRDSDEPKLFNILLTLLDIANGLKYLHDKSIIHRDLNCNNILLQTKKIETHDTRSFKAKISDFGMISLFDPNENNNSINSCGTVTHMAPELITKGRFSFQSDIYAFGIIMWELYHGHNAYHDVEDNTIINYVVMEKKRPRWCHINHTSFENLAIACWQDNVNSRPNLGTIIEKISNMIGNEITSVMKNSDRQGSLEFFRIRKKSTSTDLKT